MLSEFILWLAGDSFNYLEDKNLNSFHSRIRHFKSSEYYS